MRGECNRGLETLNRDPATHLMLGELLALEQDITKDLQVRSFDESNRDFLLQLFPKRSNVNNFTGRGMVKCHEISLLKLFGI